MAGNKTRSVRISPRTQRTLSELLNLPELPAAELDSLLADSWELGCGNAAIAVHAEPERRAALPEQGAKA
jgi:hypothetical protein